MLLLAKNYSERDERAAKVFASTYGIVFMGTPHAGSTAADWGRMAARITETFMLQRCNTALLSQLSSNNDMLQELADEFAMLLKDGRRRALLIYIFREEKPMSYSWLTGGKGLVS